MQINITRSAINKMKNILADKPGQSIRVGVKGGGCSGFSYTIDLETRPPNKFDHSIEQDGTRIIIDKKSAIFLADTTIDYESTIMTSGFVFKNPNAKSTCGCGTSFSA